MDSRSPGLKPGPGVNDSVDALVRRSVVTRRAECKSCNNLTTMQIGPPGSASAGPSGAPLPAQLLITEHLPDRLASLLAAQLDSGALTPGDRLPTEARLAVQHGVSRTVLREAVHQLKSRGLLRSRQGCGVFVTAPSPKRRATRSSAGCSPFSNNTCARRCA